MRVLIIGGTGFIGSHVTRQLREQGHDVTNFHRGQTKIVMPANVKEIIGNRSELSSFRIEFAQLAPEVVVDMIPMCEADATGLLDTFKGIAHHAIVISSADVYRNYELLRGIAEDQPDPELLIETSPLRMNLFPYRALAKETADRWYNYDKILVERVVTSEPDLPVTVLRLPFVYGPGDTKHRLFPYLKRMDDRRPAILIERGQLNWRWTRGFVENVAAAISWAAGDQKSAGRIYNVGEISALGEEDWIASIAQEVRWTGKVVALDPGQMPEQMRSGLTWQHQLATDTSLIRREPGFSEPVSFREGLARTIAWERTNQPAEINPKDFDYESEDRVLRAVL